MERDAEPRLPADPPPPCGGSTAPAARQILEMMAVPRCRWSPAPRLLSRGAPNGGSLCRRAVRTNQKKASTRRGFWPYGRAAGGDTVGGDRADRARPAVRNG